MSNEAEVAHLKPHSAHGFKKSHGLIHCFTTEHNPADHDHKEGICPGTDLEYPVLPGFLTPLSRNKTFQAQKQSMPQSPYDEISGGSVPEAGQQKNNKQVDISAYSPFPVAAEGDIDIIPEPAG